MRLLLLAGTAEARALAARLEGDARVEVTASLAGATRAPAELAAATRHGGFGGEEEQERYIKNNSFNAIIDATHPFAARISSRTQALCARLGLPYLQLIRPGWQPESGDGWHWVGSPAEVADIAPPGAGVFLATGRGLLADFAPLATEGRRLICRVVDPPDAPFPYPGGRWLVGRPGRTTEEEERLFKRLGVDLLVVKDAGGTIGTAKLAAARGLGLPVAVLRRPPQPPGDKAKSVAAALDWLERLL